MRAAYQVRFSRKTWLSIGLSAGGLQYRVNGSELRFTQAGDINERSLTSLSPDFAFGASFIPSEKKCLLLLRIFCTANFWIQPEL